MVAPSPVISAPGSTAAPGVGARPGSAAAGAVGPAVPLGAHRRPARGGAGGGRRDRDRAGAHPGGEAGPRLVDGGARATSARATCSRWCTSRSPGRSRWSARCACRARSWAGPSRPTASSRRAQQFARFYEPEGTDLELRLDPSPLDGWEQITSLLKDGRKHKGVDFKTPVGTPVKATFDGTITRKNWFFRGNGNSLEVTEATGATQEGDLPPPLRAAADPDRGDEGEAGRGHRPQREQRAQLRAPPALPADVRLRTGCSTPSTCSATQKVNLAAADRPALTEQVAKWRSMMTTPVAATPGPALQAGEVPRTR